jgi:hypothetical protein
MDEQGNHAVGSCDPANSIDFSAQVQRPFALGSVGPTRFIAVGPFVNGRPFKKHYIYRAILLLLFFGSNAIANFVVMFLGKGEGFIEIGENLVYNWRKSGQSDVGN